MKRITIAGYLAAMLIWPAVALGQNGVSGDYITLNTGPCTTYSDSGSPEGVLTGKVCDTYVQTNSPYDRWRKISGTGNTGWVKDTVGLGSPGTVTSVGLSVTGPIYTVSGTPVTTSGTLTATINTQAAHSFLAGSATSGTVAPTFRSVVADDVPATLNATTFTGGATMSAGDVVLDSTYGLRTSSTRWLSHDTGTDITTLHGGAVFGSAIQVTAGDVNLDTNYGLRTPATGIRWLYHQSSDDITYLHGGLVTASGIQATAGDLNLADFYGIRDASLGERWLYHRGSDDVSFFHGSLALGGALQLGNADSRIASEPSQDLTLNPKKNLVLNPEGGAVVPASAFSVALGTSLLPFKSCDCGELHVSTITSQDVIATSGGRLLVAPSTTLVAGIGTGDTRITVKHKNLTNGDRIYLESRGNVEFMGVGALATANRWQFEEASGTALADSVASNTATGSGTPDWTYHAPGALGDGTYGIGTTPVARVTAASFDTITPAGAYSIEYWMYMDVDAGHTKPLISQGATASSGGGDIGLWTNSRLMANGTTHTINPATTLSTGQWYHIVFVYDGATTGTFYLNGSSIGTGTWGLSDISSFSRLFYSDFGESESNDVRFANVAYYPLELTSGQVTAHHGAASQSAFDALVLADGATHYWKLNEASGTVLADSAVGASPATLRKNAVTMHVTGPLTGGFALQQGNVVTPNTLATFGSALSLSGNYTVRFWLKTPDAAVGYGAVLVEHATGTGIYMDAAGGISTGSTGITLSSYIGGHAWTSNLQPNTLYHIVLVAHAGMANATWYCNGLDCTAGLDYADVWAPDAVFNDDFNEPLYSGLVDDLIVLPSVAWSADEAAADYAGRASGYSYAVTRDLDSTGANVWQAGDGIVDTGQTGSGFIDLYALRGVKTSTEVGPTIVFNVRDSSTYNAWTPRTAVGRLDGLYGYTSTSCSSAPCYGFAAGVPSAAWVKIDPSNGFRIGYDTTTNAQIDSSGNFTMAGPAITLTGTSTSATPTGSIQFSRNTGSGFGQTGDVFSFNVTTSGSSLATMNMTNVMKGTGSSNGNARVTLTSQGWDSSGTPASTAATSLAVASGPTIDTGVFVTGNFYVTASGTSLVGGGNTGANIWQVLNSTAGTGNRAGLNAKADESTGGMIWQTSSTYNTAFSAADDPVNIASTTQLVGARSGGVVIAATNGPIKLYTNSGTTLGANLNTSQVFDAVGGFSVNNGASPGVTCTSAANVTTVLGIVTACSMPTPDLAERIAALEARIASLEAELRKRQQ